MSHSIPGADRPRFARSAHLAPAAALAALLAVSAVACSGAPTAAPTGGTPGSSAGPSSGPTAQPTAAPTVEGAIEHPTGARDVVLRVEESGGFVPVESLATSAPSFTLYGDGTVVFRDPFAVPPETTDNVFRGVPFQTVKLDEESVQALLAFAIGPGGLGAAQGPYMDNSADIPTTTFTINAGSSGKAKQVSVTGMSPELHPKDLAIVTALVGLHERLAAFGRQVAAQPYDAAAYRGVLITVDQPFGPVVEWPWDSLDPSDFKGEQEFFKTAALTPADVEALGIPESTGGFTGISLSKGGKFYTFSLRPLLPDEIA